MGVPFAAAAAAIAAVAASVTANAAATASYPSSAVDGRFLLLDAPPLPPALVTAPVFPDSRKRILPALTGAAEFGVAPPLAPPPLPLADAEALGVVAKPAARALAAAMAAARTGVGAGNCFTVGASGAMEAAR